MSSQNAQASSSTEPNSNTGPHTVVGSSPKSPYDPSKHAPTVSIPNVSLLNIEYPGIISDSSGSTTEYSSLEKALSTFHPSSLPPSTSSAHSGLQYLSQINTAGLKNVECRLGTFGRPPPSEDNPSPQESMEDVYRSPLIGEVLPTHNIVIKVTKRVWKRKKPIDGDKGKAPQAQDMELDPAFFADAPPPTSQAKPDYTREERKEYKVQVVGVATQTLRFRSMADFAYKPDLDYGTAPPSSDSMDVEGDSNSTPAKDPVLELHQALAHMDLEALKKWQVSEQLEDYEVQVDDGQGGKTRKSNLRMFPPAYFSRADVPFSYNFQQTPYSELRTVLRPPHMATLLDPVRTLTTSISTDTHMQRFVNKVRLSGIAPQPFRLGKDVDVPTNPSAEVLRIENRCDADVLNRLKEILCQRPVWSRLAFKSQLTPKEIYELEGTNGKVYFALVGYSMVGGPWRDTIVRFGYDVRKDPESRPFQRIFLRSKRDWIGTAEAGDAAEAGDEENVSRRARKSYPTSRRPDAASRLLPDRDTPGSDQDLAETRSAQLAQTVRNVHKFDGITLNRTIGNFQLCDIEDEMIKPYILREDEQWLREECDDETGWYTRRGLDLIRQLVAARFKSLMDCGLPLEKEAVDEIVKRVSAKWAEEDTTHPISAWSEDVEAEL